MTWAGWCGSGPSHTVYDPSNPSRESKRRPCVVVMEHEERFAVIFGRTEPRANRPFELVSEKSDLGKRMGLTGPTHFQGEIARLPVDFDVRGYFVTNQDDAIDPLAVADFEQWLRIKALVGT